MDTDSVSVCRYLVTEFIPAVTWPCSPPCSSHFYHQSSSYLPLIIHPSCNAFSCLFALEPPPPNQNLSLHQNSSAHLSHYLPACLLVPAWKPFTTDESLKSPRCLFCLHLGHSPVTTPMCCEVNSSNKTIKRLERQMFHNVAVNDDVFVRNRRTATGRGDEVPLIPPINRVHCLGLGQLDSLSEMSCTSWENETGWWRSVTIPAG